MTWDQFVRLLRNRTNGDEIFKEDFTDSIFMTYNQKEEEVFLYIDSFVRALRDYEKSDMSCEDFYLDNLPKIGGLK